MAESNLESLRCEKFIIFYFMALGTCDQFYVSLVKIVLCL